MFWTQKVSSVLFQYLTIQPYYAELCILVTIPLYGQKKVFNKSMSQWHMECLNKFGKKWLIELVSTSTFRILFDRHLYHLAKRQQQPIYGKCSKPNWFTTVVGFIKRNILFFLNWWAIKDYFSRDCFLRKICHPMPFDPRIIWSLSREASNEKRPCSDVELLKSQLRSENSSE